MLALLECDTRKVGLVHNLGEDQVREDRQDLVGIEPHQSIASDLSLSGRGGLFRERYLEENRAGSAGRRSRKRESGLQVPGSLL